MFRFRLPALCLSFGLIAQSTLGNTVQIGGDINGEAAGDFSGRSVALSADGSTLAVGAIFNGGNGDFSGHVRVFQNLSGAWTQIGDDIDGEAAGDQAGFSVALSASGGTLAIGAYRNGGNGANSGHVRVFQNLSGAWTQVGDDIDGEAAGDFSGYSVALSEDGGTLAVGATSNGGNGANSGHVRVFQNLSGAWTQVGDDIDGEAAGDQAGFSVALSADGGTLAVGAIFNGGNGTNSGHVRVFQNLSGAWTQIGDDIDGEAAEDWSGYSVALSDDGNSLAVGTYRNSGNGASSGHVRIFQNVSGVWTQIGDDIDGEAAGDFSGYSVALSDDGGTLAVGAYLNDGNGTDSGHVRVFQNLSGAWTQVGDDIDGEAAEDWSGWSVALSDDGNTLAVGAYRNGGNGANSGHVRVYYTLQSYSQIVTLQEAARAIVNVSARVALGEGESVIPGFVVLGQQKKLLIRAVGPKLADFGVQSPLPNPTMTIFKTRFDGEPNDVVAIVDDWKANGADVTALNAAMASTGAFPLEPTDDFQGAPRPTDDTASAATLVTLDIGVYTVVVTSSDEQVGEVLVEAYEVTD